MAGDRGTQVRFVFVVVVVVVVLVLVLVFVVVVVLVGVTGNLGAITRMLGPLEPPLRNGVHPYEHVLKK